MRELAIQSFGGASGFSEALSEFLGFLGLLDG